MATAAVRRPVRACVDEPADPEDAVGRHVGGKRGQSGDEIPDPSTDEDIQPFDRVKQDKSDSSGPDRRDPIGVDDDRAGPGAGGNAGAKNDDDDFDSNRDVGDLQGGADSGAVDDGEGIGGKVKGLKEKCPSILSSPARSPLTMLDSHVMFCA